MTESVYLVPTRSVGTRYNPVVSLKHPQIDYNTELNEDQTGYGAKTTYLIAAEGGTQEYSREHKDKQNKRSSKYTLNSSYHADLQK